MAESKAKSQAPAEVEKDQSMEEILQSIRRIIAEENNEEAAPSPKEAEKTMAKGSTILELTDVVQDDGSVVNVKAETLPAANSTAASPGGDVLNQIDSALTREAVEGIVSPKVSEAAAAVLRNVTSGVTSRELPPVQAVPFRSGATVEDLVMEALRPMLKTWLDNNLPTLVERVVEREVRRIAASVN